MNSYIELTEIYTKSSEYSSAVKAVVSEHGLRKIYINTNHIVYLQEDMALKELAHKNQLIAGLDNPLTRFSSVYLTATANCYKKIDVVGAPTIIIEKAIEAGNAA